MSPDQPVKISIILCCRNAESTIRRSIDSVVTQQGAEAELIVVDGASDDSTMSIVADFGNAVSRIVSEPDDGPAHAISKGVALATGNILCFLMADDWLEADALVAIANAFADPDVEIVSSGARMVEVSNGASVTLLERSGSQIGLTIDTILGIPFGASHYWRTDTYRKLGGFNPAFPFSNDRDLLARALFRGTSSRIIDATLYNYLVHPDSRTLGGDLGRRQAFLREHVTLADKWLTYPEARPYTDRIAAWRISQLVELMLIHWHCRDFASLIHRYTDNMLNRRFHIQLAAKAASILRRKLERLTHRAVGKS